MHREYIRFGSFGEVIENWKCQLQTLWTENEPEIRISIVLTASSGDI